LFQYGPFGDYLVESLSYGHHGGHHGGGDAVPAAGYGPPPPSYRPPNQGAELSASYEAAAGGRPKRFPDLRKREGLPKEAAAGGGSVGYWSGSPNDFHLADPPSHPSNFPLSSLFFDRRWGVIIVSGIFGEMETLDFALSSY
jgi:hypothetical protein